ncbi:MAG: OmpA family protein [Bacteroidales bacterium]|nr:OmpA family protein [Bacteroidales bacterium]MDD3861154.1 OmpA family protein [Bacteroidales bacterium]
MKIVILNTALCIVLLSTSNIFAQIKSEAIVLFDIDKFELKTSQKQVIDSLLSGINNKNYKICLSGRADSSGNISDNLILSENRVKTVADYLNAQGFESDRITYDYFGENRPLLNADNSVDLQLNRSVHMRVYIPEIATKQDTLTSYDLYRQFENDTIIYTNGGAQIIIFAGTFFPTKISDIDFKITEVYSVCDLLNNNSSLQTDDGNCLTSAGMLYVKPMLDTVELTPGGNRKIIYKIPIESGKEFDEEMKIYVEELNKKGEKVWRKIDSKMSTEDKGQRFYVFELNSFGGINIDKPVGVLCQKEGPKIRVRGFKSVDICQTYPGEMYLSRAQRRKANIYQIDEVVLDKNPQLTILAYDKKKHPYIAEGQLTELKFNKSNGIFRVKRNYFKPLPASYVEKSPEDILCERLN